MKWARAVIKYSKETQVKNSAIQLVVSGYSEDCSAGRQSACSHVARKCMKQLSQSPLLLELDYGKLFTALNTSFIAELCAMLALRCLGILLVPTKTKRADGDIPYILRFVPVSCPQLVVQSSYYSMIYASLVCVVVCNELVDKSRNTYSYLVHTMQESSYQAFTGGCLSQPFLAIQ